jgi:hypothetical protein
MARATLLATLLAPAASGLALAQVAGDAVAARIVAEPDEAVMRLVRTWAARFDTARANAMGFSADTDFESIVRGYVEDNPAAVARG